jgi:hypothetical protein
MKKAHEIAGLVVFLMGVVAVVFMDQYDLAAAAFAAAAYFQAMSNRYE